MKGRVAVLYKVEFHKCATDLKGDCERALVYT